MQSAAGGAALVAATGAGCTRQGRDDAATGQLLKVFNWSDYIHEDVIPQFVADHGCTVIYDNYSSDAELETRMATSGGAYDVIFPSDRAMHALLAKGLLAEIDKSRLPNLASLDPKFLNTPFDPGNRHSVPYFWGTLAVGVRTDFVTWPVSGFEVLFDPRLRGRITMLDDLETVVAAVLVHLGLPLNSVDPGHLEQARQLLSEQKPLVQAYTSDAYRERLIAGDAWAALGWSGDLLQAAREESRIKVVVPAVGTMIWIDSLAIPRAAQNVALAHAFINRLLDPAVALKNALAVQYASPNLAARQQLPLAMRADESIYPPEDTVSRCAWLENRGPEIEKIEAIWRQVRA